MDLTTAANFTRLLDRCYQQVLRPEQHLQQLSHLQKFVHILREQAAILNQTAEGRQYLEANECRRKLAFLYEVIGISDTKLSSHPAASTPAENNARLKYRNQAIEQQRQMLFQKSAPFEAGSNQSPSDSESSSADLVEESDDSAPINIQAELQPEVKAVSDSGQRPVVAASKEERPPSNQALPGTIDEERARHEQISGTLIHLSQSLIHRARDIGKHVRNDNKILDNVEGQSRTSAEEIHDQHQHLKRQQRESSWYACGTYCLLILVGVTFIVTYLMVKMFPKAT